MRRLLLALAVLACAHAAQACDNPRWKDVINVKVSTAGTQHQVWYSIGNILGDKYWQDFARLNPRAFDS